MQNYYKQFYPTYDYGKKTPQNHGYQPQYHQPKSAVPVMQQQHQQQLQPPRGTAPGMFPPGMPGWPMPQPAASGRPGAQQNMPDYAMFYYQYYMNAMAAAQGWPMQTGRTTPKIFIEPHIRATLATPGMLIQVSCCILKS